MKPAASPVDAVRDLVARYEASAAALRAAFVAYVRDGAHPDPAARAAGAFR